MYDDEFDMTPEMEDHLEELLDSMGYEGQYREFMKVKIVEAMQDPEYQKAMRSNVPGEVFLRIDENGSYQIHYVTDPEVMEALDELYGEDPPTIH
jgi:L-alanine-DL-glutamate epimerase-like enolase superfamily enzyme